MARAKQRLEELDVLLSEDVIDMELFKTFCHRGIPDKAGKRALCWKILLNYLPPQRLEWESLLKKQRAQYETFLQDFVTDTHTHTATDTGSFVDPLGAAVEEDTAASTSSTWDSYFKDNTVLEQIDKDVRRLCPDFVFFKGKSPVNKPVNVRLSSRVANGVLQTETIKQSRTGLNQTSRRSSGSEDDVSLGADEEQHWEVIERILFIYAKLNPGQGYVQGMNEIIGPLYYVMASDPDKAWSHHAEADTFFCFTLLMAEVRDVFIKTLDDSDIGVSALMTRLSVIVADNCLDVMEALQEMQIKPQFYAFRWLTLLLSQEFTLPDLMRLWDSLFSSSDRLAYLLYVCAAMLLNVRETIMAKDFATVVKTLQNYPGIDAAELVMHADRLRDSDAQRDRIYGYVVGGGKDL